MVAAIFPGPNLSNRPVNGELVATMRADDRRRRRLAARAAAYMRNRPIHRRPPTPQQRAPTPTPPPWWRPFWDPRRRLERSDLSRISNIRFLTETDYPPFNYIGPDGAPAGFNIDLARMICEEIKVACTVQKRLYDTLITSLNSNNGDAVIASIAETPDMRRRVDFSDPYYRTPARFVSGAASISTSGRRPEGKSCGGRHRA
jgi:polar amino acid transport system substrate-binding protein